MAHYGTLHNFRFSNEADDIRGAALYDADGKELGMITDLIFNHESGNVRYAIVDASSWFRGRYLLVPTNHIFPREEERNNYRVDLTREQINRLPAYKESSLADDRTWGDYEDKYRQAIKAAIQAFAETGREHRFSQDQHDAIDEPWTMEGDSRFNSQDLLSIGSELEQRKTKPAAAHGEMGTPLGARIGRRWSRFEDRLREELGNITGDCTTCEELRRGRREKAA